MRFDLRNVTTFWINLDRATGNAKAMTEQFGSLGFQDTRRISGRVIPPPNLPSIRLKAFGTHFVGCGQSHLDALTLSTTSKTTLPFLVLEDDAISTSAFNPIIDIPEGTDAVYLGVSHGNKNQAIIDLNNGWYRIVGMLTTHAILYTSKRFVDAAMTSIKESIYKKQIPLDSGYGMLQGSYNVIAPQSPMFIQGNSRESINKWESLTNKPLKPTHVFANGAIQEIKP